jgi:hypothetical protein
MDGLFCACKVPSENWRGRGHRAPGCFVEVRALSHDRSWSRLGVVWFGGRALWATIDSYTRFYRSAVVRARVRVFGRLGGDQLRPM